MAALFQLRPTLLRRGTAGLLFLLVLTSGVMPASPAAFLDAVLAAQDDTSITASDIALARALSLFGFHPADDPIRTTDVKRLLDARLVEREAARVGIGGSPKEAEEAWEASAAPWGGTPALMAWAEEHGIPELWARELVQADLRWRRFIDLRFRAFVFVSETDVAKALGPGAHPPAERERARSLLQADAVQGELDRWLVEARARARIQMAPVGVEPVPNPIPMPPTPAAVPRP
jgi:hypothetical protein